jgi:hypothetical protein
MEERAATARRPNNKEGRPRQRRRSIPLETCDMPPVDRPPRRGVRPGPAPPPVAPQKPPLTLATTQQSVCEELCSGGPCDGGIPSMDDDDEEGMHAPMHAFLLLVRVPRFLLDSTVLTSDKDSLIGIATSSRIDDTRGELLYHVHLESGHSLEINVGFLEIILPNPKGYEADIQLATKLVDNQQLQTHGRYSSCEDETDDECSQNQWPTKMLHNPHFLNFSWNSPGPGGCGEEVETNSEIERAALSLECEWLSWGEAVPHEGRAREAMSQQGAAQGRGRRCRRRGGEGAGRVVTRTFSDGRTDERMDDRTMAAGASVT